MELMGAIVVPVSNGCRLGNAHSTIAAARRAALNSKSPIRFSPRQLGLRVFAKYGQGAKPMIGFGDPLFGVRQTRGVVLGLLSTKTPALETIDDLQADCATTGRTAARS